MKFWIRNETEFIYLDQMLKAVDFADDYDLIIDAIKKGQISVNKETEFQRRKILREGDEVSFFGKHYKILGKEAAAVERLRKSETGHVKLGKGMKKWVEKPIKKRKQD